MPSTVISRIEGLTTSVAVKPPIRIMTSSPITLSGEQTITSTLPNGQTVQKTVLDGERVGVNAQADAKENGIYVVKTTAWVRAEDFNGSLDAVLGTVVLDEVPLIWKLQTPNPVLFGTSNISFDVENGFNQAKSNQVTHDNRTLDLYLDEFPHIADFGAIGEGDDEPAFVAADTNGQLTYLPKVTGGYEFGSSFSTVAGAWFADPGMSWDELTDGGLFDMHRGHFSGSGNGANHWRFSDRVFIGEAASKWAGASAGVPDAGTSWLSDDANGPAFLGVHAHLLVTTHEDTGSGARYAIVGAAKTSTLTNNGGIGVAGAIINDKAGSPGWAFYADVQAEISDNYTYGMELAMKNASGVNVTLTPYSAPASVIGIWLAAGGDSAYGPAPTHPSGAGVVIGDGDSTWNTGLLFLADGITGTDGTSGSATFATAIGMGRNQEVTWYEPTNGGYGAKVRSRVTATANRVMLDFLDNQAVIRGANEQAIFTALYVASTANNIAVSSAAATAAPQVQAVGSDTNIDLRLMSKGTGVVRYGTFTSSGDVAVNGYITIKDDAGNLRKLATIA